MCIIVVKDKHNPLPKASYLENCFDNNPDGAGFMYTKRNKVVIDKGYMTYKSFMKQYDKLCRKFNNFKNKSLIIHFRIGTAGSNSKKNTHPYPITDNISKLHAKYIRTDLGMAHNGIIQEYNPTRKEKRLDINDTQNFIIKYVYPLYSHYKDFYKNQYITSGLEDITGSRLAFLDKNDIITLVGEFEKDEDGIKYSNDGFKSNWYTRYYLSNTNRYYNTTEYYNTKNTYERDNTYDLQLESNWYISVEEKELEKVGDRRLIYDYYEGGLYELLDSGQYEFISHMVDIFDENGEEVIL